MAVPKYRPVFERLEVVETGRRRRWTEDEKLRIVAESLSGCASGFVDGATVRHLAIAADDVASAVPGTAFPWWGSRDRGSCRRWSSRRARPAVQPTLSSTRMEIVVSRDRRIIVDAGVDVAALARVLDLLSRR